MPGITPTGPAVLANDLPANEQYENATATLVGGGRVVAWIDFTDGHVKLIAFDAEGEEIVTYDDQGMLVGFVSNADTLPGEKRAPTIWPNPNGGFDLSWTYTDSNGNTAIAIRRFGFQSELVGGQLRPFGDETLVDLGGTDPFALSSGAAFPGGGSVLAWSSSLGGQDITGQLFGGDGQPVGAPFMINTGATGQQGAPSVVANTDGFWTLYNTNAGGSTLIQLQQFDNNGAKVGNQRFVGEATSDTSLGPDAAFLDNGDFVITFVRQAAGSVQELVARVYKLIGGLQPEIVIATLAEGVVGSPSVTSIAGGGFAVSWIPLVFGPDPLMGRLYDATGGAPVPFGDAFMIADSARFQITSGTSRLQDGRIIFSWDGAGPGDSQGVFTRTFQVTDFGNVPTAGNDELWDGAPTTDNDATISGGDGDDTVRAYDGDDVVNGDGGNDKLFGGLGNDAMNGGDGNDFGLINQLLDNFIGGAGTDTAGVQGNFIGTLGIDATTEVVLVASGADTRFGDYAGNLYDYNITLGALLLPNGQNLTFQAAGLGAGEDFTLNAAALQGAVRVFAGAGLTNVIGGVGSDGAFFGNPPAFNPANLINLGDNVDTLAFRGNYVGGYALNLTAGQLGGVDVIGLLSGHINPFGGFIDTNGFDFDLTLPDGFLGVGGTIDVNGNTLRANESVDVDASAVQVGSVRFFLGAGDDIVVGSANADLIFGNLGADQLDGGPGGDTYVYRNVLDSTAISQDNVIFGAGDRFDLSFIDAILGTPAVNDPFSFIGAAAFGNVAGQLRLGVNVIQGDIDGDGVADLVIGFTGTPPIETDFNL